jgi:undecaprenyl diphosphate synthase
LTRTAKGLRDNVTPGSEDLSIKIDQLKHGIIPQHVAIIMDGNGRWAKKRHKPRIFGHKAGAKAIREVVEIADDLGVEYLTLYAFSTENWRRPKDEVSGLMNLFEEQIRKELGELDRRNAQIHVIGRTAEIPQRTRNAFTEAEERTKENTGLKFYIAINYSGRSEIMDAVKSYCAAVSDGEEKRDLDENVFEDYLYTAGVPDPELLIRTSGERRISNFLLWQIAYSEIVITEKYWPEFKKNDFIEAVAEFQTRKRRFGGLDEE